MMNLRDNKETLYGTKEGEASSSSRQWSLGHKNPRIVRVSRAFGGKDRHSKVCTIKGLRDRRIRLSVPTAIQVYDLQDRLGLGQPSKVIDWLLDITKLDIDKLPPLPAIPTSFPPFQHAVYDSQGVHGMLPLSPSDPFRDMNLVSSRRGDDGVDINRSLSSIDVNEDPLFVGGSKYWDSKQRRIGDNDDQVFAQNLLPIASGNSSVTPNNPSTFLSYSNYPMYNYYHSREPSNVSLTQMSSLGLSSHNNNHQGGNSLRSSSSGSPRMFLSPSMANSSLNSQHAAYTTHHHQVEDDHDIQQFNHFKMSNDNNPFPSSPYTSTSLGLKPFPLYQDNKNDDESPWKSSRNS